jgi:DNA-binding transcriptional regulator YiaG
MAAMKPKDLKARRNQLKLSQTQLAKKLRVHMMTVSRWERGVIEIPHMVEAAMREIEKESR